MTVYLNDTNDLPFSVKEKSSRNDGFTPASRAMRKTIGLSHKAQAVNKEIK